MVCFSFRRWLDRLSSAPCRRARKRGSSHTERLEGRLVLSSYAVTSTLDSVDLNPGDGLAADVNGNATLRAAVMDANAVAGADQITLGAGVFSLSLAGTNEDGAVQGDLDVIGDLTIDGAGTGQTILDAAFLDRFFQVSAGSSLTLRNVTIQNGRAAAGGAIDNSGTLVLENVTLTGNSATLRGGAITNNSGSVTLTSVIAANNETRDAVPGGGNSIGGAVSSNGGSLTISSSQFANNVAAADGGAIDARSTTVQVSSTSFRNNTAKIGGAVRLFNGAATFISDTWNGDHAIISGGAIASSYNALTITGGSFTGNSLSPMSPDGGSRSGGSLYLVGLNPSSTIANITNVTFQQTGSGNGGAIYNLNGRVNLHGSVFDRVTGDSGGSIVNAPGGSMLITNTTFVGGQANWGGAIANTAGATIQMYNSTITGNASGGQFILSAAVTNSGSFFSTNNLIAGNIQGTATGGEFFVAGGASLNSTSTDGFDVSGSFLGDGGNLIGNRGNATGFNMPSDQVGTPSLPINPVLLPLADNGGPVKTMALGAGSPARDKGLFSGPTTDARGFPRSGRPDVGAYEFQNHAPVAGPFDVTSNEDEVLTGRLPATDEDGDSLTYELLSAAPVGTLVVQPNGDFSYTPRANRNDTFFFSYRVTDGGLVSNTVNARIVVLPVNDPPAAANQTFVISENRPNGAFVGPITITDIDSSVVSGEIISGNDGGAFVFDGQARALVVANSSQLNFETHPTFTLVVRLTDDGSPAASSLTTITVNLRDVNEPHTLGNPTYSIDENSPNGTIIGSVPVIDEDTNGHYLFEFASGVPSTRFGLNSATGEISVLDSTQFDFETGPVRFVPVRVTDLDNPNFVQFGTVTVQINDVNEAPVALNQTFSVPENAEPGRSIGWLNVTDVDSSAFTADIISGNDNGAIGIDPSSGVLFVADGSTLNFEAIQSLNLVVRLTDNGVPAASRLVPVTINIRDVNELHTVGNPTFNIDENSPNGTVIGSVPVFDEDPVGHYLFEFASGVPSTRFGLNSATGELSVLDSTQFDFETIPVRFVQIRVTDLDNPNLVQFGIVTVQINNINEAPDAMNTTFSVPENLEPGRLIGWLNVTDVDSSAFTSEIVSGNDSGAIGIDGQSGALFVLDSSTLNFETTTSLNLVVRLTDNGNPAASRLVPITINLSDVNESPVIAGASLTISENSPIDTVVGSVVGSDPDVGQSLTYSIVSGNANGAFAINSVTGQLTVANPGALDFETTPAFHLVVRATDNGTSSLSADAVVSIALTDVIEGPVIAPQGFSIAENTANNAIVGTVIATNPVAGQGLTYAIVSGNTNGAFSINSTTGQIRVAGTSALNYETNPIFGLVVRATQNGSPNLTSTATITISLTNVNEGPQISAQSVSIAENAPNGTLVGSILASDPDVGQPLTYSITSGNTNGAFSINPSTGQLTVANSAALNYEVRQSFSLVIRVADTGTPSLSASATVVVSVTNLNEAPQISMQSYSLAENSANGTTVGTVSASDPDSGQSRTFAIVSGNTNGAFSINASTGQIKVANSAALNFEATPTFSLSVRATDNGSPSLSSTATITISLTNVNESPAIQAQQFSLAENSANGTTVGTVAATDPDASQSLTFAIVSGNTNGAFTINSTTGRIVVANSSVLDFETRPTLTLQVRATDNGSPSRSSTASVTINLTDVVESMSVALDVIPGDSTNTIRLSRNIEVAILSTSTFDARNINVSTVRFGRLGTENSVNRTPQGLPKYSLRDVNNDGRLDLIVEVDAGDTGLRTGDTLAKLTGQLNSGLSITSSSSVVVRN